MPSYYTVSTILFALFGFVWSRSTWIDLAMKGLLYGMALAGLFEVLRANGILVRL